MLASVCRARNPSKTRKLRRARPAGESAPSGERRATAVRCLRAALAADHGVRNQPDVVAAVGAGQWYGEGVDDGLRVEAREIAVLAWRQRAWHGVSRVEVCFRNRARARHFAGHDCVATPSVDSQFTGLASFGSGVQPGTSPCADSAARRLSAPKPCSMHWRKRVVQTRPDGPAMPVAFAGILQNACGLAAVGVHVRARRDDHQETEMVTHRNTLCYALESTISDYVAACDRTEKKS